jgi:hypothetical protein
MKPEASLPVRIGGSGPRIGTVSQIGDKLTDLGRQNIRNRETSAAQNRSYVNDSSLVSVRSVVKPDRTRIIPHKNLLKFQNT